MLRIHLVFEPCCLHSGLVFELCPCIFTGMIWHNVWTPQPLVWCVKSLFYAYSRFDRAAASSFQVIKCDMRDTYHIGIYALIHTGASTSLTGSATWGCVASWHWGSWMPLDSLAARFHCSNHLCAITVRIVPSAETSVPQRWAPKWKCCNVSYQFSCGY